MKPICVWLLSVAAAFAQANPNGLNDKGLAALDQGQFDAAEKLFLEAIATWRAHGPAYDLHVALVENNLAQVYCVTGERAKCASTLEQSLAVMRRTIGMRDLRTLTVVNLLGGVDMMLGNHARSDALFREALPIERELFPQDAQLARSLSGLASLAMQENRAADAEPMAEEALRISLAAEGEDSLDAALAYANLAEAHRVQGRPDRAEPLFRKARAVYEKKLGPDHPRVSSVLAQEGVIAMHEGKLGTADAMLTRVLAMLERSCPKCVYERVAAQNDLALLRVRQGKIAEADRLLTAVLAEQDHAGVPPAEIETALSTLATVRQKERRFDDAARLKRRADSLRSTYR